jgi:hypothetical protein
LLKRLDRVPDGSSQLPRSRLSPVSLLCQDYPNVRYWMEKAYDEYLKAENGDTDGLATRKPRRGRPLNNDEEDNDKHPYLEDHEGIPVN